MARKNRSFNTFNLSFLDIMSCGFGAVALIFLLIKHNFDHQLEDVNKELSAEVKILQEEITFGKEHLSIIQNTLDVSNDELENAHGLSQRIIEHIEELKGNIAEIDNSNSEDNINTLKEKIKKLDQSKKDLEEENEKLGNNVRKFVGDGDRQYLTGLRLGGDRILVLLDSSASMLGDKIINVIRIRNMSSRIKRETEKWRRAIKTVSWLTSQFPQQSQYQIYAFNNTFNPILKGTDDRWLNVDDRDQLNSVIKSLEKLTPKNGTNLELVFSAINNISPLPDNIILLTDGLPTQGIKYTKRNTISGKDRRKLFHKAIKSLPKGIPINIILSPMEGDPFAASEYWKLAMRTNGSFLAPSKDWP